MEQNEKHIVKGTEIKGVFPVEGNGIAYCIGSDQYGRVIGKVINGGEMIEVLNPKVYDIVNDKYFTQFDRMLVLVTRKNSKNRGWYVEGHQDKNGKWVPNAYQRGCGSWCVLDTKGAPADYLDPSF